MTEEKKERCETGQQLHRLFSEDNLACVYEDCPIAILNKIDSLFGPGGRIQMEHAQMREGLNDMKAQFQAVKEIASHTGAMAECLKEQRDDNKAMVALLAGKKQVPLSVAMMMMGSVILMSLIMLAAATKLQLNIGNDGVSISHSAASAAELSTPTPKP